jgi:hypothetical protein
MVALLVPEEHRLAPIPQSSFQVQPELQELDRLGELEEEEVVLVVPVGLDLGLEEQVALLVIVV